MDSNMNNHFGTFVSDRINELNQTVIQSMIDRGKTTDEIEQFFESDEYGRIYVDTCHMLAKSLTDSLETYSNEDDENERTERANYLEHIRSFWGQGLIWMRQFSLKCSDICNGWGWMINQSSVKSDKCNTFQALFGIHAKALLVYEEITCLLENGYPDGAFALFRTLYELWAVAEFLYHDEDEVARAFLESYNEGTNSETGHYKWALKSSRFTAIDNATINGIVTEAHKTFRTGCEDKVSMSFLKRVYAFPNLIIHPAAQGIFSRTSHVPDDITLVGRAVTGLATPAINSSMYIFNITRLFLSMIPNSVSSIGILMLDHFIGQRIVPFFEETEKKLTESRGETP